MSLILCSFMWRMLHDVSCQGWEFYKVNYDDVYARRGKKVRDSTAHSPILLLLDYFFIFPFSYYDSLVCPLKLMIESHSSHFFFTFAGDVIDVVFKLQAGLAERSRSTWYLVPPVGTVRG